MINRSIYAIILGLAVVTSGHTAEPTSKSVSVNLKIKDTNPGIFHCSGSVDYPELFKWEISASDLKEGVGCGQGDFDGNGTLDFFLYKSEGFKGKGAAVLVLFLEGQKLKRFYWLEKRFSIPPDVYSLKKYDKSLEEWSCPKPTHDGIIEWGEGGDSHVFLYNDVTDIFAESVCASESE